MVVKCTYKSDTQTYVHNFDLLFVTWLKGKFKRKSQQLSRLAGIPKHHARLILRIKQETEVATVRHIVWSSISYDCHYGVAIVKIRITLKVDS